MRQRGARVAVLLAAGVVLVGCAGPPDASTPPTGGIPAPATSAPATTRSTSAPPGAPPAPAAGTVEPITAADLGASWHPGCPVGPRLLRRVHVEHLGTDGQTHRGLLIVHEEAVADIVAIFDRLYRLGFPIAKIRPAADYPGAEDELSMQDNNTSAFNCRGIPGSDNWSLHAYGRAVDLNPLVNPCVYASGYVEPRTGTPYLDRSRVDPGLLHTDDPAIGVFTDLGWRWGGSWHNPIDYQHFERP
ncbi:MAG: M15 family metallopeptidase [Mycobacterium sp.]